MNSWTPRRPSPVLRRRLFGEPAETEVAPGGMGWFAPALSAACLFAAALLPATVPERAHADTTGTNTALLAALDHANGQSLMNHLAASSFKSTNISAARSTNALSTGWN